MIHVQREIHYVICKIIGNQLDIISTYSHKCKCLYNANLKNELILSDKLKCIFVYWRLLICFGGKYLICSPPTKRFLFYLSLNYKNPKRRQVYTYWRIDRNLLQSKLHLMADLYHLLLLYRTLPYRRRVYQPKWVFNMVHACFPATLIYIQALDLVVCACVCICVCVYMCVFGMPL